MMFKISASLMSTRLIKGTRPLLEIRFSRRSTRYKISMFCIPPSQQARLPLTYPFYLLFVYIKQSSYGMRQIGAILLDSVDLVQARDWQVPLTHAYIYNTRQ